MQSAEQSPQRKRRRAKQRARQDERWAARSGDVSIRQMTETERRSFEA